MIEKKKRPGKGGGQEKMKGLTESEYNTILKELEVLAGATFYDKNSARRFLKKLYETRKIQSLEESIGDKQAGIYVDKKFPVTNLLDHKEVLTNEMLKTNWYLGRVFNGLDISIKPNTFIRENVSRLNKKEGSMMEWIIGSVFLLTQNSSNGFVGDSAKRTYLKTYMDDFFERVVYKDALDQKTLETDLIAYESYKKDKEGKL